VVSPCETSPSRETYVEGKRAATEKRKKILLIKSNAEIGKKSKAGTDKRYRKVKGSESEENSRHLLGNGGRVEDEILKTRKTTMHSTRPGPDQGTHNKWTRHLYRGEGKKRTRKKLKKKALKEKMPRPKNRAKKKEILLKKGQKRGKSRGEKNVGLPAGRASGLQLFEKSGYFGTQRTRESYGKDGQTKWGKRWKGKVTRRGGRGRQRENVSGLH